MAGNLLTTYRTARSAFPAVVLDLTGPCRQSGKSEVNGGTPASAPYPHRRSRTPALPMLPRRRFFGPHRQSKTCRGAAPGSSRRGTGTLRGDGPPLQPDSTDGSTLTGDPIFMHRRLRDGLGSRFSGVAGAPSTTEVAVDHTLRLSERLRLVHRQLADAKHDLPFLPLSLDRGPPR